MAKSRSFTSAGIAGLWLLATSGGGTGVAAAAPEVNPDPPGVAIVRREIEATRQELIAPVAKTVDQVNAVLTQANRTYNSGKATLESIRAAAGRVAAVAKSLASVLKLLRQGDPEARRNYAVANGFMKVGRDGKYVVGNDGKPQLDDELVERTQFLADLKKAREIQATLPPPDAQTESRLKSLRERVSRAKTTAESSRLLADPLWSAPESLAYFKRQVELISLSIALNSATAHARRYVGAQATGLPLISDADVASFLKEGQVRDLDIARAWKTTERGVPIGVAVPVATLSAEGL